MQIGKAVYPDPNRNNGKKAFVTILVVTVLAVVFFLTK